MKSTVLMFAIALFAAATPAIAQSPAPAPIPAGTYSLDPAHASLVFRVSHMGFSNFTSRFTSFDAKLDFDPAHPERAKVSATVDPTSVEIFGSDLANILKSAQWFDTAKFPQMVFKSTKIELTGGKTARITGDLTFHGITQPVTLDANFNGGYGKNPFDPKGARIGFSAHGSLKRSAFGVAFGIPAPGSNMGVSDQVDFILEVEFSKST